MRLFVAIDLDDLARQAIAAEQLRIAGSLAPRHSSIRWVDPARLHLTLAFLGQVAETVTPAIVEAMSTAIDVARFTAVFQGLGVFPPHRAPRILWLGVSDGARQMGLVHEAVASRLRALGVAVEERSFHAHLTLARWRTSRAGDAPRALACDRRAIVADATVDHVTLYHSQRLPAGPRYLPLARATLS